MDEIIQTIIEIVIISLLFMGAFAALWKLLEFLSAF